MEWTNQGVLITGAGRGLGAALARALAAQGARVVAVARGPEVEAVVADIRATGNQAWALRADIADKDQTYALAGSAAALAGAVDVVIHNASTLGPLPLAPLLDLACEDLQAVLETNLVGPFRLSKALVGPMLVRGRGLVVHLSSDAAVEAYPTWGAYGVSKAALDHLTRIWAAELEGTGVRFLAVDPGEMNTQMHRDAVPDADPADLADPATVAQTLTRWLTETEASGDRVRAADLEAS